jgi:hypothetical protein
MKLPKRNQVPFDSPAIYQIRVQGGIDNNWSDRLEDMAISLSSMEGESPVTTLEGKLNDQSALAGVLNTLYELHLPVLSVERKIQISDSCLDVLPRLTTIFLEHKNRLEIYTYGNQG